ncbi:MAG: spore germination protein [Clostridia bacterium]|nr:spore germination protein [Clostridia bacterium]
MNNKIPFKDSYNDNVAFLDDYLRVNDNFDLVAREIKIGSRPAKMYFVDGFAKDEILEKVMEFIMRLTDEDLEPYKSTREFANKFLPYIEVDVHSEVETFSTFIYAGAIGLIVDGCKGGILIDARTYPVRSVEEPDNDRVLRGSREGFVETVIFNTALIRRKIRNRDLTMEIHQVGKRSKTDIVLCYLNNKVDKKLLKHLQKNLSKINVNALAMSQESLAECLVKKQHFNPFPKVRYTERPDSAAACIYEGDIIVLVDGSPAAMIVPTSFFEFLQDTNDFYFPPIVGSYLRIVRAIIFGLALLLTPVWYLLIQNQQLIPEWLAFIKIDEPYTIPVFAQLMMIELVVDALKLASLNTPSSLSNSLSIIGALVLGELAVSAQLFSSEVVLFMAFVAIANFAQPSIELGYAFKLSRVFILVMTAFFNIVGFCVALILTILMIAFTGTVSGKSYLYPLIPFNGKALLSLFFRLPINNENN